MSRLIPESWMPECGMERVITHWTAGAHHASAIDREHYHILIEADGRLVRGDHSIRDNISTADDNYAAHTAQCNTGSIGIAVCCMLGAIQQPFAAGRFPLTQKQYEALTAAVADLCARYRIAVAPETVLGHGEVEAILRRPQRQKWDPMVLPWDPALPARAVGDTFRRGVASLLARPGLPDDLPPVTVFLDGQRITDEAILKGGTAWTPLRPLAEALHWTILDIDRRSAQLRTPDGDREIAAVIRGDRGFVQVRDLCAQMGWPPPVWDAAARTIQLRSG